MEKRALVKGISREEELETEREKRKEKERWVGRQQHVGHSNQRERWEQQLHSQRGNAAPGQAYVILPGRLKAWIPLRPVSQTVSYMTLARHAQLSITAKLRARLQRT